MEFSKQVPILKVEDEQRIVWGWAYVTDLDGFGVVDHSGEMAEAAEMQKAAHGFVEDSRTGGVMHSRRAGQIVDSLFFSKDIQSALGIDLGKIGWFIGFRVDDDRAWEGVKNGTLKAFSIGGSAKQEDIGDGGP